jgi:hypothetical protein
MKARATAAGRICGCFRGLKLMERRSVARLVSLHDDNRRLATAAGQARVGTRLPTS